MEWSAPLSNGGSPVTSYKIYSDQGSGIMYNYVGTSTLTEFTHSSLGPPGTVFKYQVSAVNAVGEGPLSSVL